MESPGHYMTKKNGTLSLIEFKMLNGSICIELAKRNKFEFNVADPKIIAFKQPNAFT